MRPPSLYKRLAERELYRNPWVAVHIHEIIHPTGAAGEHISIATGHASGVLVVDGDAFVLANLHQAAGIRTVVRTYHQQNVGQRHYRFDA